MRSTLVGHHKRKAVFRENLSISTFNQTSDPPGATPNIVISSKKNRCGGLALTFFDMPGDRRVMQVIDLSFVTSILLTIFYVTNDADGG